MTFILFIRNPNADKGSVKVDFSRSVGSLQIFVVGVSIRGCSWLPFVVATSISFFQCVLCQDSVSSTLCSGDEGSQAYVAWGVAAADVLSAIARSCFKQRVGFHSSKPCLVMASAGVPFPRHLSSALFKPRWTTNNRRKKTTIELFNVILFSLRRFV
jgi:hypothetical protein